MDVINYTPSVEKVLHISVLDVTGTRVVTSSYITAYNSCAYFLSYGEDDQIFCGWRKRDAVGVCVKD